MSDEAQARLLNGRYRVLNLIARGRTGTVQLARDEPSGRLVVLKAVPAPRPGDTLWLTGEAQILDRIQDENVVRYFGIFVEDEVAYLVLEYIENGVPLDVWQADRFLADVCRVYSTLATTLTRLHESGIVHGDLKPSNVLVRNNRPVLLDFGFASLLGHAKPLVTDADIIAGTPAYMAPEALRGPGRVGPPADVFSLGVMWFEALTGTLPEGHVDNVGALLTLRTTKRAITTAVQKIASVPRYHQIADILEKVLASSPEARLSARELGKRWLALSKDQKLAPVRLPLSAGAEAPFQAEAKPTLSPHSTSIHADPGATRRAVDPEVSTRKGPEWNKIVLPLAFAGLGLLLGSILWGDPLTFLPWFLLVIGIGIGAMLMAQHLTRKHRRRSLPDELTPEAVRRIAAIEAHLQASQEFTQSLAIQIESVIEDKLHAAVRESVLVAMKELAPTEARPRSDMDRVIGILEQVIVKKPETKPWTEKVQAHVAIGTAAIAGCGGLVGLLALLGVWSPNRPPDVSEFRAASEAIRPGASVHLKLEVKDADGDELSFSYTTNDGLVSGAGPAPLFTASRGGEHRVATVTATVSDGHEHVVHKVLGISIVPVPPVHIKFHTPPTAGQRVQLSAEVPEGLAETLAFNWIANTGAFDSSVLNATMWSLPPDAAPTATVTCRVKDSLGEVPISQTVDVLRAMPRP